MASEGVPLLGHIGHRVTKHDPLLAISGSRTTAALLMGMEDEGGTHHTALRTMVLTAGSCSVFTGMLLAVCRHYHRAPFSTIFLALQLAVAGVVLSMLWRRARWQRWMGRFVAFAALAGTMVGLILYYRYLVYFYHYREMKAYSNVAASQPAELFADAGMLGFTADSRLDVWQSVGYRSASIGKTLCVAPVVDSLMQPTDAISFFAAGVNCCSYRSRFHCGDAGDALATSGLLELSPEQLVSPYMEWAVEDPGLLEGLHEAVKLQSAVHGTVVSAKPRFLRWARDPRALRDAYLRQAVASASAACAIFLGASLAASLLAALGRRRLAAVLDIVRADAAIVAARAVKGRRGVPSQDVGRLDAFSGSGG